MKKSRLRSVKRRNILQHDCNNETPLKSERRFSIWNPTIYSIFIFISRITSVTSLVKTSRYDSNSPGTTKHLQKQRREFPRNASHRERFVTQIAGSCSTEAKQFTKLSSVISRPIGNSGQDIFVLAFGNSRYGELVASEHHGHGRNSRN